MCDSVQARFQVAITDGDDSGFLEGSHCVASATVLGEEILATAERGLHYLLADCVLCVSITVKLDSYHVGFYQAKVMI